MGDSYNDIISFLEDHKEDLTSIPWVDYKGFIRSIEDAQRSISLSKMFKIPDIRKKRGDHFIKLKDHVHLSKQPDISWEDQGRVPKEGECLLTLRFPAGAYTFGRECPNSFFKKFFEELKEYGPKYCDTVNKILYFDHHNAYEIYEDFDKIFSRYMAEYREGAKERRRQELLKELEKLEGKV